MARETDSDHDGYFRAYVTDERGRIGIAIVGVVTLAPGEVDVDLDPELEPGEIWVDLGEHPSSTPRLDTIDEIAIAHMTADLLDSGERATSHDVSPHLRRRRSL